MCIRDRINVSAGIARHRNDAPAGHRGAGRIGAVGGSGNEADAPARLSARFVKFLYDKEAGVFALRAGIGLQRTTEKARDRAEPLLELPENNLVAAGCLLYTSRVYSFELGQAYSYFDCSLLCPFCTVQVRRKIQEFKSRLRFDPPSPKATAR